MTEFNCPDCLRPRFFGRRPGPCRTCNDAKTVTVDAAAIRAALVVTRGASKGQLRRSRPAVPGEKGAVYGAAYVWRMVRFHCGQDMHMPVMAFDYIGVGGIIRDEDKPLLAVLDRLADEVGAELFGRAATLRAAARWTVALEGADKVLPGGGVTAGQLATALGVRDCGNGLDVGGPVESPEAAVSY